MMLLPIVLNFGVRNRRITTNLMIACLHSLLSPAKRKFNSLIISIFYSIYSRNKVYYRKNAKNYYSNLSIPT